MDTQLLKIVGGIAIVLLVTWLEERKSGKRKQKAAPQSKSPKPVRQHTARKAGQTVRLEPVPAPASAPASAPVLFEEGMRSTTDMPDVPTVAPQEQPRLRKPDIETLRRAVIWSEILKPKF